VDFTPEPTQQAVIAAAAAVLDRPRPQLDGWDRSLWKDLASVGLLSLAQSDGGDGLGVLETATLLTEIGRRAAAVPALATLMLGVLPVARWADHAVQRELLSGVGAGDTVLTAALREPSDPMPAAPAVTLREHTLSGIKTGVPYLADATAVLVPASLAGGGTAVVVIDPAGPGVTVIPTPHEHTLRLDDAPIRYVLGQGGAAVADLYQLALAGACCLADGAVAQALTMTTAHVGSRRQFGRPLATFQAVAQHIADVYIASRTLHLATQSACWRLAMGRDAGADLDVAAWWLTEHAPAALRTCHHLHGGLGMDVSYPLHRYSALVTDLAQFAGGADFRLDRLGDRVCHVP
jgi:3-oxo-4-pregnene-20-carboxyl-CoA dehydrogenase alpha subunit